MNCKHCGQPLLSLRCDACCGRGYLWARDEVGETPVACWQCGGSGKETPCTNTACPGITWYPLSRAERAILGGIERDEASKK